MRIEAHIRKMARSQYYQEIFNASQKCSGIHLFENVSNFSGLQFLFIYWLRVYNLLYEELGKMDWENLDEKVIEDDDRTDAFLYYRSKQIEKDMKKMKAEERKAKKKPGTMGLPIFSGSKKGDK